ncbi:MAG: hypothetical protein NTU88_17435, partial [Armatimonadetes bacterium]|nr:hypothetical protein [Armatimonadota bacterium]
ILRIRISEKGERGFRLWIPLFLFWPVLVLVAFIAPVVIVASPRLRRRSSVKSVLMSGPCFLEALCAVRGLRVDVRDEQDCVSIVLS